jgi:hypothetical protein
MAMLSMTPNLCKFLNVVTLFKILGELMYFYLSRMGTNSSRLKVFFGAPWGHNSSSSTSSLVASITIAEFVACGVLSTYSLKRI